MIEYASDKDAINVIKDVILQTVQCERIYLFGSYAYGTPNKDSDYDFYVLIPDEGMMPIDATHKIYYALTQQTPYQKPIDIFVKKFSDFENRKTLLTFEKEVANKGVVLHGN